MSVTGAADKEVPVPPPPPEAACDFCAGLPAVVYCRADSARLCLPCDRHVHGANTVATRHARAPLCAGCRAAVSRRGGFLCANCRFEEDEERRRGGDREPLHDLGAVEGYSGCPSIADLAAVLGVGGCESGKAAAGDGPWWPAWEEPRVLRLEDVPTTSCHDLQPLLTPPSSPTKNRSSGGHGQLTAEVIRQLGELARSEAAAEAETETIMAQLPPSEYAIIGHGDFGALDAEACNDAATMAVPSSCEHEFEAWIGTEAAREQAPGPAPESSSAEPCLSAFVEMSEICPGMDLGHGGSSDGSKPDSTGTATPPPRQQTAATATAAAKKGGYDVAYPDRGTVISRYKEKRKNRRFDKQIRYESRKARADGRLRIKGRFAKSGEVA